MTVPLVCLLGGISQGAVLVTSRFPAFQAPLRGTDFPLLGEIVGQKVGPDEIGLMPEEIRPWFCVGFGKRLFWTVPSSEWPALAHHPALRADKVWEGIGIAWLESGHSAQAGAFLPSLAPQDRRALRKGLSIYGEVAFTPLLIQAPSGAAAAFLHGFAPEDQPRLRLSLARTAAVLATQGLVPPERFAAVVPKLLTPLEAAAGAGWSLYRGTADDGAPRMWKPSGGAWTAGERERGGAGFWEGMAEAYEWHLAARSSSWLLGGRSGPTALARDLEAHTRRLPIEHAARFYRAAGRAAAVALAEEPRADRRAGASPRPALKRTEADWPWRRWIPLSYQEAFAQGMDAAETPSREEAAP